MKEVKPTPIRFKRRVVQNLVLAILIDCTTQDMVVFQMHDVYLSVLTLRFTCAWFQPLKPFTHRCHGDLAEPIAK